MSEPWLPLNGVRVVDFSMFVPGPFASSILADLGADVIKVEPPGGGTGPLPRPGGDPGRSYVPVQFETENRNKRSLALDLKNADAKAVVAKLVERAHVVVEGFRPGVAKRLGIDYETLRRHNGRLVYCSISGYGQTGPWRARPGHDVNYVAAAGGLAFPGQWLKPPARSSLPVADMAGGAFAATAILAALREGKGGYLDLSLFEAAFFLTAMRHGLDAEVDARAHLFPVNDVFETADGQRLTLGILEEHFWQNFVRIVPELGDARFATDAKRRANGDALSRELERVLGTKTAAEWLRLCDENDVPVDLCVTPGEAAKHPQLVERKATERGHAKFPVWANGRRAGSIRHGTPKLGEHSREILVELGFEDGEIADLRKKGAVL
ncbi:MAG TPA: CaiB/BaiF CoA-transferase family protein [Burkholderiales bacterium]|nr:CaiB/BaiF CoA-transferase family protein [Burkholderiales bacterium]